MKKLDAINFLDSFIEGSVLILLPMLLLKRGINISTIGIIFSVLPLAFMFIRLVSAYLADEVGLKNFFLLNSVFNFLHLFTYFAASSPQAYLFGKVLEGAKGAFIWAVNRSSIILFAAKERIDLEIARVMAIRILACALGAFAAGFLLAKTGFETVFSLLMFFCLLIAFASFLLPKDRPTGGKMGLKKMLGNLDLMRKGNAFIAASIVMAFRMAGLSTMISMVIPIFLRESGFGYETIGILLASYYVVSSLTMFFVLRKKIGMRTASTLQIFFFCPAVMAMGMLGSHLLIALALMSVAIADGLGAVVWELLIYNSTKGSKILSTDIGVLHIPSNVSNSMALFAFGFVIDRSGFIPVFFICAAAFLAYSAGAFRLAPA